MYRATDTKLDREVALKVLPQAFTEDPDRLTRFEREAKVLASLNHPNIGHIYGPGTEVGVVLDDLARQFVPRNNVAGRTCSLRSR